MSEEEAKAWIAAQFGPEAVDRLGRFAALLIAENERQNLIAPSTVPSIWSRHLVDSAQLARFGAGEGTWLDIGTGGGLPGLVLALLVDRPFRLVEPRRLRAEFLQRCVAELGLTDRVAVLPSRIEAVSGVAGTISARAVSSLDMLIAAARHCANRSTIWVLPRGQKGAAELQASTMRRAGTFHVELSLTDPDAVILVATGIGRA